MQTIYKVFSSLLATLTIIFGTIGPTAADDCSKGQRAEMPSCISYHLRSPYIYFDNQCGYTVVVKVDKSGCTDALFDVGPGKTSGDFGGCNVHQVRCCRVMTPGPCGPAVPGR